MVEANQHQIFRSTDTLNWAPRFGFAWSPAGADKTVVRGGFGIFFDAFPAFLGDTFMTNLPGVVPTSQFGLLPWADQSTQVRGSSPATQRNRSRAALPAALPTLR
jgi:hypothetical protein